MTNLVALLWIVEALVLAVFGALAIVSPERLCQIWAVAPSPDLLAALRLSAPTVFGAALVVGSAATVPLRFLRTTSATWLGLSGLLVVAAGWGSGLVDHTIFAAPRLHLIVLGLLSAAALLQLIFSALPEETGDIGQISYRAADFIPHIEPVWQWQGIFWGVVGALGLIMPRAFLHHLIPSFSIGEVTPVAMQVVRISGALAVGLGCMSWLRAGPQSQAGVDRTTSVAWLWHLTTAVSLLYVTRPVALGLGTIAAIIFLGLFTAANFASRIYHLWMEDSVRWVMRNVLGFWAVQATIFILGALYWMFLPVRVLSQLGHLTDPAYTVAQDYPVGIDYINVIGPMALGMGGLTFIAMMRATASMRREMGAMFTIFLGSWVLIFWYNVTGHFGAVPVARLSALSVILAMPAMFLFIINLIVGSANAYDYGQNLYEGSAVTQPKFLWGFWLLQGFFFLALAILFGFFPGFAAKQMLVAAALPKLLPKPVELDQVRLSASYYITYATLSFWGMTLTKQWRWHQIARLFSVWQAIFVIIFLYGFESASYHSWLLLVGVVFGTLAVINDRAAVAPIAISDLGGGEEPNDLITGDLVPAIPMAIQTITTRSRASHLVGVGASGTLQITVPPGADRTFPHNSFFTQYNQQKLGIVMRFANLTFKDDAALDVRGAAFSVSTPETKHAFEMVFNTGSFSPPRNVLEFTKFVLSKWAPKWLERRVLLTDIVAREGGVAGLRRAPTSYAALYYYSQIVRIWVGSRMSTPGAADDPQARRQSVVAPSPIAGLLPDQVMNLVRYRLLPDQLIAPEPRAVAADLRGRPELLAQTDLLPESGLPDDEDAAALWNRQRRPANKAPVNYLREELTRRLNDGEAVVFHLQAQFHEAHEPAFATGEALSWYNAGVDWDVRRCPWRDLGRIELVRPLCEKDTEDLRFNPRNMPGSLGIPTSTSLSDYRSLGDVEARVMGALANLRAGVYKLLGYPKAKRS